MQRRDQALDGLRGLAALAVAGGHSILTITGLSVWGLTYTGFPTHSPFEVAARLGYLVAPSDAAVMIFFVLSGHVLWSMFCRRYSGIRDLPRCLGERLWRLLPTSIAVGLLLALISRCGYFPPVERMELLKTMLILSRSTNGVLWSLQVEIVCSILLFCVWALMGGRRHLFPLIGIASIALYYKAMDVLPADYKFNADYALYLLPFLAGASISLVPSRLARSLFTALIGFGILVGSSLFVGHSVAARYHETLGAFLLVAYVRDRQPPALTCRPAQFLGSISYPFYLIHPLCIALAMASIRWIPVEREGLRIVALFLTSASYAIAGAWLVHRLVEAPAMRLRSAGPAKMLLPRRPARPL